MMCLQQITYRYPNGRQALVDVSCSFEPGRVTCLVVQSGAGKTSLLRIAAGLLDGYTGMVECNQFCVRGMDRVTRAQYMGMVFQSYNLFSHLSVLQNCMQPLRLVRNFSQSEACAQAEAALAQFGLVAFVNAKPAELSGGQQQRVALARAMCMEPKVLFLDEPSAALDPHNSALLAHLLKELAAQGVAVVVSSHDMALIKSLADRIYLMAEGRIEACYDTKDAAKNVQAELVVRFVGDELNLNKTVAVTYTHATITPK